ncbi:MAG: ATP-binding protein [Methanomassiliicoccales archaeon]|nr:MAG: ATP-binding protein [Methanomassiliicoccales archaeon]
MEELLHRSNPWWTGKFEFPGIAREGHLSTLLRLRESKDVVLITGLRRVGKTTLMLQLVHRLLEEMDSRLIFYVSLDHIGLKERSIIETVDGYRAANGLKHDDFVYLFLDEVHFKEDFELQLKNLYDEGNSKVYASGSSSLDIVMKSPHLTGRQRILHLSPLSFREYLMFLGKEISPADQHLYPPLAEEYLETGGMPEYVLTRDPNNLQSMVDSILYRDIAGRHDIRNRENLLDILSLIAQSVGTPISLRKISRVLGIPVDVVSRIVNLFVEANLVHMVEKEGKMSERKGSPRKIYLADNGLFGMLTEKVNYGSLVENIVFLAVRREGSVRYYRTSGLEIDFVRGKGAWEVKYKSAVDEKDLAGLKSLKGFKSRTMVTKDKEGKVDGIDLVPLWKFLLQDLLIPSL